MQTSNVGDRTDVPEARPIPECSAERELIRARPDDSARLELAVAPGGLSDTVNVALTREYVALALRLPFALVGLPRALRARKANRRRAPSLDAPVAAQRTFGAPAAAQHNAATPLGRRGSQYRPRRETSSGEALELLPPLA